MGSEMCIRDSPSSDEEFAFALDELNGLLAGGEGPYILSDKRWRSGPVYFRYGAFVPPSDDAPFVSTLIDPEGNEVEDPRRPTYTLLLRRCAAECFL